MRPAKHKPDAPGAIPTATEIQSARGLAHSKSFTQALAFWSAAVPCRFSARTRSLEPEWLDELEPEDPRALRSRRDLLRVNLWMLNCRTVARALRANACVGARLRRTGAPRRLVEVGAGDGRMMLQVAGRLGTAPAGSSLVLLDRQNIISPETRTALEKIG